MIIIKEQNKVSYLCRRDRISDGAHLHSVRTSGGNTEHSTLIQYKSFRLENREAVRLSDRIGSQMIK